MWPVFVVATVVTILLLYVPGTLFMRGMGLSLPIAAASAPFASVFLYVVTGILLSRLGIVASWVMLAAVALVLSGAVLLVSRVRGGGEALVLGPSRRSARSGWLVLIGFVAVGVIVGICCLLNVMDGPDAFPRQFDAVFHLACIRSFAEGGCFSILDVTNFRDGLGYGAGWGGSFYPAAWHVVGAMVFQATGSSVPLVLNALDFVFSAVVFPTSMFALLSYVFDDRPAVVVAGSLVTVAFVAFPWRLLTYGLLCGNLASFAMTPAVAAAFACLIDPERGRGHRRGLLVAFVVGCVSLVAAQPNAIFTMAVMLWPLCAWRVTGLAGRMHVSVRARPVVRVMLVASFLALAAGAWVMLYRAPFMQGVLEIDWWPVYGRREGAVELLLLAYREPMRQVALAILVIVGGIHTLRDRRYLWLSFSYASMLAIHFLVVATDGRWKHLLAGFWYRDPFRTASSCVLMAVPLAALGLYVVCRAAGAVCTRVSSRRQPERAAHAPSRELPTAKAPAAVVSCLVAAVVCALVYAARLPGESAPAFSLVTAVDASEYDMRDNPFLDATELSFAQRCKSIVGDGLVYNYPDDGSAFLYGAVGIHTYYRSLNADFGSEEPEASRDLRLRLDRIGTDPDVAAAARDAGVKYVLLLDVGEAEVQPHFIAYEPEKWAGVTAVGDDTPGLEVVLSEGDMRLYRVVA
jgi:hypothetical protein